MFFVFYSFCYNNYNNLFDIGYYPSNLLFIEEYNSRLSLQLTSSYILIPNYAQFFPRCK